MSTPCCRCPLRPLRVTLGVAQRSLRMSATMSSNSSQDLGLGSSDVVGEGIRTPTLEQYHTGRVFSKGLKRKRQDGGVNERVTIWGSRRASAGGSQDIRVACPRYPRS